MAELVPVVALPAVVVVVEVVEAGSGFKSESPELGKDRLDEENVAKPARVGL